MTAGGEGSGVVSGAGEAPGADAGPVVTHEAAPADRRRTVLVGIGCVLALGLALGAPQLLDTEPPEPVPTAGPTPTPEPADELLAPIEPMAGSPLELPPRGSLVDQPDFLDGVRALPWVVPAARATPGYEDQPEPLVERRSVVFAGDVPGGRWAVVAGWVTLDAGDQGGYIPEEPQPYEELVVAWFTGPPGAGPTELTLQEHPRHVPPHWPIALTDPRTGALLVLATPGDVVEYSARPEIAADGTASREWHPLETVEGVALTRIPAWPRVYDASTAYRVRHGGQLSAQDRPWSAWAEDSPVGPIPVAYPRGGRTPQGEQAVRAAAEWTIAELGLHPDEVDVTAQWVGSVPADGVKQAAIVTTTLPSGAVVAEARVTVPGEGGEPAWAAQCGRALLPAGPPADRRVFAASCQDFDVTTGTVPSIYLVVVGPPEVALVRTYDGRTFLTEHTAVDGVLVVPMPSGADTVEAVTSGGVTLGRVDLLGHRLDLGT